MASRFRLTVQLVLIAAVAVLAFPASGSALSAAFVQLTPTGPSPAALTIAAGLYPVWVNNGSAAHTVVFANGVCTIHVAPGAIAQCPAGFSVGAYTYTVDGTAAGSLTVSPDSRSVTLAARQHEIRPGARLTLHGLLNYAQEGPPRVVGLSTTSMRVAILARPDRRHPFRAVASVRPATLSRKGYPWQRVIRPRKTTIYMVAARTDTDWQPAQSKPFKVVVRR
jgi:plastocyanin